MTTNGRLAEAERTHGDDQPSVEIPGPHGLMRINRLDYVRRLPAYEEMARLDGLPVRAVWLVLHEVDDGLIAATGITRHTEREQPQYTVWFNIGRTRCAAHRLGSFLHEAAHIREGHCLRRGSESEVVEREAVANAARDRGIQPYLQMIEANTEIGLDGRRCVRCVAGFEQPCPQGPAVFDAVQQALAPL